MNDLKYTFRLAAIFAAGCAGLALAGAAHAVDLRDWGKKYAASERFVVLAQFNNQAVLDKETQLVWQATAGLETQLFPGQELWIDAYFHCLSAKTGGRRGWRLPTHEELASVIGELNSMPPALSGVSWGIYHTVTMHPLLEGYALALSVPGGVQSYVTNLSTLKQKTWCVRGPS